MYLRQAATQRTVKNFSKRDMALYVLRKDESCRIHFATIVHEDQKFLTSFFSHIICSEGHFFVI